MLILFVLDTIHGPGMSETERVNEREKAGEGEGEKRKRERERKAPSRAGKRGDLT